MTPYFQMMSECRSRIESQRRMRELLRSVRGDRAAPVVSPLAEAIMTALYGGLEE